MRLMKAEQAIGGEGVDCLECFSALEGHRHWIGEVDLRGAEDGAYFEVAAGEEAGHDAYNSPKLWDFMLKLILMKELGSN